MNAQLSARLLDENPNYEVATARHMTDQWFALMNCPLPTLTVTNKEDLVDAVKTNLAHLQTILGSFSQRTLLLELCKQKVARQPQKLSEIFFGFETFDFKITNEQERESFSSLLTQIAIENSLGTNEERTSLAHHFGLYSEARFQLIKTTA